MKKIVISNRKGGIGKTTTAVTIAYILAREENKVLLIDTDQQANSTDTLSGKINGVGTLYDILIENPDIDINSVIQKTPYENLDIIASDPLLVKADEVIKNDVNGIFRMQDIMEKLDGMYDYVIIDTAPYINSIFHNCLIASDELIIPIIADRYSLQGLSSLIEQINAIKKRANPKLHIAGILLTNVNKRTILTRDVKDTLNDIASKMKTTVFKSEIRSCNKVKEGQVMRKPLPVYSPSCSAALDYENLVEEMKEGGIL